MKRLLSIGFALAFCMVFAIPAWAPTDCSLIVNGDFESGNTGFSSDYTFVDPSLHYLYDPGTYTVDTSPRNVHTSWADYGDHTSGEGNMLIVNAATEANNPGVTVIWSQTVSPLIPNFDYVLTYYLSSSYPDNLAQIEASINGTPIGVDYAPGTVGVWQEVSHTWNSGAASSAEIVLEDLTRKYHGDDFAIDDICLRPVPHEAFDLCAGQHTDVGDVIVWNDGEYLYVKYLITDPDWCMTETHLHVANTLEGIPQTKKGNPIPGHFDYAMEHDCVTEYTYQIPLSSLNSCELHIAAHAAVVVERPSDSGEVCAGGVFDSFQAPMKNGQPVSARGFANIYPENALGLPDSTYGQHGTFFSLGYGGHISFSFPSFVGGSLKVYETTWGPFPVETAEVYVSRDGSTWTLLGTADNTGDAPSNNPHPTTLQFDGCVEYVRIVDTTDPGLHAPVSDAFDVDAVCAEYSCAEETAWGDGCEGSPFNDKNWATYFTYTVPCDGP